ncbi:MAG: phosphoglucosamine mutase [Gaiellales bacterium]|nr:MAG: phosphoglucosamine mutase [Gaiellales bacterium]
MTRKYFGTDGIRGVANKALTADLALQVGRAAVAVLPADGPRILIGRDTRISGRMLEAALIAGICSAGGMVLRAGVVPTPAVASLVVREEADAGVVISASHNPYEDNGIKFFGSSGFKLTDEQEAEMESYLTGAADLPEPGEPGPVEGLAGATRSYVDAVLENFRMDLAGFRVLLDCANGATYLSSPLAFETLGATVDVIADQPDGYNINRDCGSTHIGILQERMRGGRYDAGFAYDGDGDRVIAVDGNGDVVDGDFVMAICANHLKNGGALPGNTIVTTVMTNLGFHNAVRELGIEVRTTDVGDRYVLEEMLAGGFGFGGEQSGHIINLASGTTGDGLATSLLLTQVMQETGAPLAELATIMERLPQKLVNVRVGNMAGLDEAEEVWEAVEQESAALQEKGRVLVRPSGTEPVVRVMVEAPTLEECGAVCDRLAGIIERSLA